MSEEAKAPLMVAKEGAVTILSINDAPINRMSLEFMDELEEKVNGIARDDSVRSVVMTAEGDVNFSVGMHLKQMAAGTEDRGGFQVVLDQRLRVLSLIENMGKPWVATLFGYCLGGGLELPLACHFRVAAEADAKIGLPELDIGAVPAWGGSARLTRCVGRMHALDMILRAKHISGPEAYRIGLVNEVVPNAQLKQRAIEIAQEVSAMPPKNVAEMMRCVTEAGERSLAEGLVEERKAVLATRGTKDSFEGMRAFMEKRKPVFTGE